jgi:hypothetical protein
VSIQRRTIRNELLETLGLLIFVARTEADLSLFLLALPKF